MEPYGKLQMHSYRYLISIPARMASGVLPVIIESGRYTLTDFDRNLKKTTRNASSSRMLLIQYPKGDFIKKILMLSDLLEDV